MSTEATVLADSTLPPKLFLGGQTDLGPENKYSGKTKTGIPWAVHHVLTTI